MNQDTEKKDPQTLHHTEDLAVLKNYLGQSDPVPLIFQRTLLLALIGGGMYLFLAHVVPTHRLYWFQFISWAYPDFSSFSLQVDKYLVVENAIRLNRLMLICYLSLYFAMWWVYFQSKIPSPQTKPGRVKPLETQTLRRLLGFSSEHWNNRPESNDELVETYRSKGSAGMQVLAILIAVSLLIFDEIGDIWISGQAMSLWQYSILWTGLFAAAIAFIGFVLSVDAFDTMFNKFKTDNVHNILVNYFYSYTINPRYMATASLLLSLLLLLAFYSEVLAALAISCIVTFGFGFWFPHIYNNSLHIFEDEPDNSRSRNYKPLAIALILFPILWQLPVLIWS